MKGAIWGYLVKRIEKARNFLNYRSVEQMAGQKLPEGASRNSFDTWLQKAPRHARLAAQKRNTPRFALISLRLLMILMICCFSFLLITIVQNTANAPVMAASLAQTPDPNGYKLYIGTLCVGHTHEQVPDEWKDPARGDVCDATTGDAFVKPSSNNGPCPQYWIATTTQTGQQECVLTVPSLGSSCPTGFALEGGLCAYQPQDSADWQVGFCRSFKSYEVPLEWISSHICDINPLPTPDQTFVQPSGNNACQQNWVQTMTQTGQQECVLTVPSLRSSCPIGFDLKDGRCQYVPLNSGSWQTGFCKSFTADEIPPEWISNQICDIPNPDPEHTFIKGVPCQPSWIGTTNATGQVECILTVPSVRGLCPVGFALNEAKCDYVPLSKTTWEVGFCQSFTSDEVPPEWISNHVCDTNPVPDPDTTFIKSGPCANNWISTIVEGNNTSKCALTVPAVRGLCPIGFTLQGANCDYQSKPTVWVVGFCKSFTSDEVPPEWITYHVCDVNPIPDPETTFIKAEPCVGNWWIRTVAEGGDAPKCALRVPDIKGLCPIGFALDGASCNYIPRNLVGWQFPCSDQHNGLPNEAAIAGDWLAGDSPQTVNVSSDPAVTDGTTGGRFMHTFAADTYGLQSVQRVFSYMLGLAFLLVTPIIILIGYHLLLAASSFRHAGVLEGLSRVLLGALAVGVSFQLVTMLITFANEISSAIVNLHAMMSYPRGQIGTGGATFTLPGVPEPLTSYRGLVMPMSRWGCAANDFIGILGGKFFNNQVTALFPVIGNLAPLTTQVTNGTQLVSRLSEFTRLVLSVVLWLQTVIRIGLLNCYILTCPLVFACWSLPGGLGRSVLGQWMRGFFGLLFIQVGQLFLITTLPLLLPSFPALAGDNLGIMYVLLTQLPPLLVLWLTVRVPTFVGINVGRAVGMAGVMAGGIVGTVGEATSLLG